MVEFMRNSDQAIIAAGGTLWELLSMGCAILSYSRNVVQARVVGALSQRGALIDMGDTLHFDPETLVTSVKTLAASRLHRERMTDLGRTIVDGLGAARVIEAMQRRGAQ
jgi:spore coat polysaccharide biosynthesis predicted glycosyltransferase SpsG